MTGRASSQELAGLLESGEVKAALLLKGEFSDSEADLIRRAWEAGLDAGRSERDTLAARLQAAEEALRNLEDRLLEAERIDRNHGLTLPGDSALYIALWGIEERRALEEAAE